MYMSIQLEDRSLHQWMMADSLKGTVYSLKASCCLCIILNTSESHIISKSCCITHTPTYLSHTGACINHFPSCSAAVYYHDNKTVPGRTVTMICAASSQQFHFQSLLVQEQIGNTEGRVALLRRWGADPDLSPGAGC